MEKYKQWMEVNCKHYGKRRISDKEGKKAERDNAKFIWQIWQIRTKQEEKDYEEFCRRTGGRKV